MKTIFYSWQSDVRAAACRTLVQNALDRVAQRLARDGALGVDPVVDRDVQGLPGSPVIAAAIFSKIERASAFVADVTIVGTTGGGRPTPNPNVLIELGYAYKALGDSRVVLVQNTALGGPELLPFDLRHKFILTYASAPDDTERATPRRDLEQRLETALRMIVQQDIQAPDAVPPEIELAIDHRTRSRASDVHHYELVVSVRNVSARRIDDWEVDIEFPTELIEPNVHVGIRVAEQSDAMRSLFRAGSRTLREPLRLRDHREITIPYRVDTHIFRNRSELFSESASARASVDGRLVAHVERPINELENF